MSLLADNKSSITTQSLLLARNIILMAAKLHFCWGNTWLLSGRKGKRWSVDSLNAHQVIKFELPCVGWPIISK